MTPDIDNCPKIQVRPVYSTITINEVFLVFVLIAIITKLLYLLQYVITGKSNFLLFFL